MTAKTNHIKLTDAIVKGTPFPTGKSQHYLHDTEQDGLALRMRASGAKSWVFIFRQKGARGSEKKTLGSWPMINVKAARDAAKIAAGQLAKEIDPNAANREAKHKAKTKHATLGS